MDGHTKRPHKTFSGGLGVFRAGMGKDWPEAVKAMKTEVLRHRQNRLLGEKRVKLRSALCSQTETVYVSCPRFTHKTCAGFPPQKVEVVPLKTSKPFETTHSRFRRSGNAPNVRHSVHSGVRHNRTARVTMGEFPVVNVWCHAPYHGFLNNRCGRWGSKALWTLSSAIRYPPFSS